MRVCILGHYPPHIGGVSSHTYLLAQELIERGDEVYVLTYPHQNIDGNSAQNRNMKNDSPIKVETSFAPNVKGLRGLFFLISSFFKLRSMVYQYNIELIHAHFLLPPGLIGVLVGSFLGKNTAVTAHGSDLLIQAKNPILRPIIKFVLGKADYVLVVNETLKDEVLEMGINPKKVFITPNAVDIHKFSPNNKIIPSDIKLNNELPTLLFVGNLVTQKGLKYLLDAKKLMKNYSELMVVGDGPLRRELEDTVNREGILNVSFLGARRDVEHIMPSADVFVLSSVSEGFPITILEALASGLPVVATNVGGVQEIVDESVGIVVEAGNPSELAKALDYVLENEEVKKSMETASRNHALKYSSLKIPY